MIGKDTYLRKRFIAHWNLIKILNNQRIHSEDPTFYPRTVEEYAANWRLKVVEGNRAVVLERDATPESIVVADPENPFGIPLTVLIIFLDVGSGKINSGHIHEHVEQYLVEHFGYGEEYFTLNQNVQIILLTKSELEGQAKGQLIVLNSLLKRGVKHFTVDDLQFDPTQHITQPKVEKATQEEIRAFIESQKELLVGSFRLAQNIEDRLKEADSEEEREKILKEADDEILGKLATINSNDPLVKWYGFRIGDILKITRRIGMSKFAYRKVVLDLSSI
jgi:DNA-directed RNA polymerase subunit H (RpoH/RPB5)